MKKLPILMLSLMTLPAYAQSILSTLNSHQDSLKTPETNSAGGSGSGGSSNSSTGPDVKPSTETISSSSAKCEEADQTSLPLAYVTSLIQQKNAALDITHDPRSGSLTISSENMIGNCSSMLEWKLKQPEVMGKKSYAVEVNIKQGQECAADGCSYKVTKVENGEFKAHEVMKFKPTLKGFEECLQKSGVVVAGKVVASAIYPAPVKEKFSGLDHSGPLLFLSHGPSSPIVKAKYGKFEHIVGCDHYEAAHPQVKSLLTLADAEKERLDAEAAKLKECKVDEYGKLADFIEKYENYSSELGDIRDRLILEAAKKSALAIAEGKYTEDDLKVLADFERYMVNPKVEHAKFLYDEMIELEGDAKKAKQEELKAVLAQIAALNVKPYFTGLHTQKLIADGRFEEAEKLNSFKLVLENHQRLGAKQDNVVITPGVAAQRIAAAKATFAQSIVREKERYEIRTGQSSGKAQYNANLAARMRSNIQVRTQNYTAEIQLEYERIQQPNGYCYKYWRNAQKCIQETAERIQELQALALHYNKIDAERALEYDALAKDYGDLEAQGRRYIAAQNGEEVPADVPVVAEPQDTTVPGARPQDPQGNQPGVYSFNFQGGGQQQQPGQMPYQQQAQYTPQQYQYPTSPYQNQNNFQQQSPYGYQQQQQNPWMGQQAYGMQGQMGMGYQQQQGSYNFNYAGGGMQNQMGYQQQQPYGYQQQQSPYGYQQQQGAGYWNQPNQAYGQYSVYGRTW